ncbi:MAG: ABC transporter ATP-binding protein [Candidatus Nanopelagicales bacterium]
MSLLRVSGISVRIGGLQILDGVSLEVPEGRIVGLIGPNGAGKTTLFNVISGFVAPTAGHVEWRGERQQWQPQDLVGAGIARTLQAVGLFDSLNVLQNVVLGAHREQRTGAGSFLSSPRMRRRDTELQERARALLEQLGIADVAQRLPADLPYPTRKRVALARALISDPALVMLDEPAGGISAADIADLAILVRGMKPERSVLVVEHHMDFVMGVCDHIYVLDAGKLIAEGDPAGIRSNPAVRVAYLGEAAA